MFSLSHQLNNSYACFLSAGDFNPLQYEVFGSDTNITVTEVTKGKSNMATFTLLWEGIPTKPIAYNATETEVSSNIHDYYFPLSVGLFKPEI